jgi:hypothetical protein
MKRTFLFLAIIVMVTVLTASVLSLSKDGENITTLMTTNAIPDDLKVIFKNSCMDCHATGGKGMAMAKLNFSDWDNYSPDKQVRKADAICKIVTKGTMPPKSYGEKNPNAIPTASQKDMICKWSKTLVTEE